MEASYAMTTATKNPLVEQAKLMAQASSPRAAQDVPTIDTLLRRYGQLVIKFNSRNATYLDLLRLYDSDPVAHGMVGGDDESEIIINEIFDIVNTLVDFTGIPPNMTFLPPSLDDEGAEYADNMEKYLYANWAESDMDNLYPRLMFDEALLGTAYSGLKPTEKLDGFIEYRRFTPVNFYPQTKAGSNKVVYYFYAEKVKREEALEKFGSEALSGAGGSVAWKTIWPDGTLDPDEIIVLEYCDSEWFILMVMDKPVLIINHKFGFCPSVIFSNIVKPDIVGGVSAVATYKSLQIYQSNLAGIVADILGYWADPMLFIKSEKLTQEDVRLGGITIGGPNDDAKFIVPDLKTETIGAEMKRIKEVIHDGTIPESLYGRLQVKGTLGSAPALSGLQMKFMVKLNSQYRRNGASLVKLNTMALSMAEKLYKGKKIKATGWKKNRYFDLDMRGSEIKAYKRHRVFWDNSLIEPDRHAITQMQLAGNKLQSRYTTQENLGMSAVDEAKRMLQEAIQDIRIEAAKKAEIARLSGQFTESGESSRPVDVAREQRRAEKGGAVYPTASGESRPEPGRPRSVSSPASRAGASAAASNFDARRVVADLAAVKKLKGEVYLAGVGDTVDVALTDKLDKQTILNAPTMQAYKGRIVFVAVKPGQARQEWARVK